MPKSYLDRDYAHILRCSTKIDGLRPKWLKVGRFLSLLVEAFHEFLSSVTVNTP